jgi:hypothetical protein
MKKKTIISLCLIAVICFACFAPALAAGNNATRGIVTFSSGMPKVAGTTNQYNPYAIASVGLPEQLSVGFTLYKIVNGNEVYVTSDSDGGHGNYFEAEALVNLSSGTYKLYAYYRGETKSDGSVKTYNIG